MSDQDAISQLLKVGEKYLSNQQSHLMEMSFSVRSYSPRVAMHYQVHFTLFALLLSFFWTLFLKKSFVFRWLSSLGS